MPSVSFPQDSQVAPRRKKRGLWWKIPLMILALLVVAAFGNKWYWDRQVASAMQTVRDAGYPITAEQLNAWYPEPEGVNAADIYAEAFELFVEDEDIEQRIPTFSYKVEPEPEWPPLGGSLSADVKQACEAYLELNREALSALKIAKDIQESRFPVDFTQGIEMDTSHLSRLRRATRLLQIQTRVYADNGDSSAAFESILKQIALAQAIRDEPMLVSHYVRISIYAMTIDNIEETMARVDFNDAQLQTLQETLATIEVFQSLHDALIGERAIANHTLKEHQLNGWSAKPNSSFLGLLQSNQVQIIEVIPELLAYCVAPVWPEPKISDRFSESPWSGLTLVFFRGVESAIQTTWISETHLRTTITALAAKRYHLKHGNWPHAPEQLVPEFLEQVPMDAFSTSNPGDLVQPLKFKSAPFGLIVYSVDMDGVDDHGVRYDHRGTPYRKGTDITAYAFTTPGIVQPGVEQPSDRQ